MTYSKSHTTFTQATCIQCQKFMFLSCNNFLDKISKIENLERRIVIVPNNQNKCVRFRKKWYRIENKFLMNLKGWEGKINVGDLFSF